jgi:hypothetical protein
MAYQRVSRCLAIARFSIAISITRLNNEAHYSHAWIHIERSSWLITVEKQTIELVITSHTTHTMLGTNCRFVEPQNGPTPHEHSICCSKCGTTHIHPFVQICNKELPSHHNHFALWTILSHQNLTSYRYAIIGKSRWMSRAPLPFGSSLLVGIPITCVTLGHIPRTSQQSTHINRNMPSGITSKSTSPWHLAPILSS